MEHKIYFTDLDETLLTSDKKIGPETEKVLKDIVEAGHYIALSSGRALESIQNIASILPVPKKNLFYSAYNGSLIVDATTGETIHEIRLSMEDAAYFINYCHKKHINVQSYDDGYIINTELSPELEIYYKNILMPYKLVPDIIASLSKPPFKCLALSLKGPQVLDELAGELASWAGDRISLIKSSDMLLEEIPSNSGKGQALEVLAAHLGIPVKNTLASGDQENDISMIKAAGLGVAMINGVDEAKAVADVITKEDNNHDGLVPILREFFDV